MIKRPMLGLAAAWLCGLMFTRAQLPFEISTIAICYGILILVFFFCLWKWPHGLDSYVTPKRYPQLTLFLFLVPCLFWAGSRRMEKEQLFLENCSVPWQRLEEAGEDYVFAEGTVREKICEEDGVTLVLGNCVIAGYEESDEKNSAKDSGKGLLEVHENAVGGCRVFVGTEGSGYLPQTFVGNRVRVYGKFSVYRTAGNPGQFDAFSYYSGQGQYASVKAVRMDILDASVSDLGHAMFLFKQKLRSVFSVLYPEEKAGVLTAMLLGDKDLLDPEVKQLYQQNGISHILAISGLHISMLCMGLYGVFRKVGVPVWVASLVSVLFLSFYICFTGASTSSLRAGVMCMVLIFGKLVRRSYDLLSSLALAAVLVTVLRPMEIVSAGFLLSFGAVLGVALAQMVEKRIQEWQEECQGALIHALLRYTQTFVFGGMIQLFTMPISLWFYYELSPYSVCLNLVIIPLASFIMGGGLCSLLIGMVWTGPAQFLAGGVYLLLELYERLGAAVQRLPYSFVLLGQPKGWQVVLYYACLLFGAWCFAKREQWARVRYGVLGFVMCIVVLLLPRKNSFELSFLDVSQGDGILLHTEEGQTLLFDGGSSDIKQLTKYRIAPVLKQDGVAVIDSVSVSHMDSDHYSGVLEILEAMPEFVDERTFRRNYKGDILIRELVMPIVSEPSEEYQELVTLALSKNVAVRYTEAGNVLYAEDGLLVECLAPVAAKKSENDTSLVFLLQTPELVAWLMGDAGAEPERDLMKRLENAWGDEDSEKFCVLKVGHHGSKTSSCREFIQFVSPDVAIVSCGYQNSYGHPHESVMETLAACGCQVFRTDLQGAVTMECGRNGEVVVSGWREER